MHNAIFKHLKFGKEVAAWKFATGYTDSLPSTLKQNSSTLNLSGMKFNSVARKARYILILLFSFSGDSFIYSQIRFEVKGKDIDNVKAINEWVSNASKEYAIGTLTTVSNWSSGHGYHKPGEYPAEIKYANFNYEHLWTTLFSDEHFVPVFGEAPDMMSEKTIKNIATTLKTCFDNKELDGLTNWTIEAYDALNTKYNVSLNQYYRAPTNWVGMLYHQLSTGNHLKYIPRIRELRTARQSYNEALAKLSVPGASLNAEEFSNFPMQKYKALLPDELLALMRKLDQAKKNNTENIDQTRIDAVLATVLAIPPGPEAVNRILGFSRVNKTALQNLSSTQEVRTALNERFDYVLNEIMENENRKIEILIV